VTLNDRAYNIERNVAIGNPYKDHAADLMKRGTKIELCGATTKAPYLGPRHPRQYGRPDEDDTVASRGNREDHRVNQKR
jgi:hypothetical protein